MSEQTKVTVSAKALGDLLHALSGPGHLIREMQATSHLPARLLGGKENPIAVLIKEYNEQIKD